MSFCEYCGSPIPPGEGIIVAEGRLVCNKICRISYRNFLNKKILSELKHTSKSRKIPANDLNSKLTDDLFKGLTFLILGIVVTLITYFRAKQYGGT
ncbi:hypothetical protein BVY01_04630 [bacterium I07]|nr:hypothetical protein BVY01_04630 [bacterium I07]